MSVAARVPLSHTVLPSARTLLCDDFVNKARVAIIAGRTERLRRNRQRAGGQANATAPHLHQVPLSLGSVPGYTARASLNGLCYGVGPSVCIRHAVAQAQQYIAQGYGWVIDLDLEKFFDRVNHDKLMSQIAKRIEDKRLLKLIRAFSAPMRWSAAKRSGHNSGLGVLGRLSNSGKQVGDLVGGVIRKPGQHVSDPDWRIDVVHLGYGGTMAASVRTGEGPVSSSDRLRRNACSAALFARQTTAVGEEAGERCPAVEKVVDRLGGIVLVESNARCRCLQISSSAMTGRHCSRRTASRCSVLPRLRHKRTKSARPNCRLVQCTLAEVQPDRPRPRSTGRGKRRAANVPCRNPKPTLLRHQPAIPNGFDASSAATSSRSG